ncbi:histidine--tRNA ligase [Candidatus Saccharibacteria bacterium]|nr:histidine--tRNA ligase [Candidatus Saccharibacteria bacterium]
MGQIEYQKPRGMQDILPSDQVLWAHITETYIGLCESAGIERISTPILESTALFTRAVGEGTEVVSKEMYSFDDKSGNSLTLKPESTAGVARSYIENGMNSLPKPVLLYYLEPNFRYERPQSGRYRQHNQLGLEIFGDPTPNSDVQVINLGARLFNKLGIGYLLSINCIGSAEDRKKYIEVLKKYFTKYSADLPDINKKQLETNPLRILDSKDPNVVQLIEDSPQILDYLGKESSARFQQILELLERCGVAYQLNSRLVRGLDYYNGTVFEFLSTSGTARDSLGGGGRYDKLVQQMGGADTPAVGMGLGVERIKLELEHLKFVPDATPPDVFVVAIGGQATNEAEVVREYLLNEGFRVRANLSKKSLGDQLALASKSKAKHAIVIGNREAKLNEVIIKDLASGNQQVISRDKLIATLKALLSP